MQKALFFALNLNHGVGRTNIFSFLFIAFYKEKFIPPVEVLSHVFP